MESVEVNRVDDLTEGMSTHIVGAELPEGPAMVLHYGEMAIAISDLYEGKRLVPTGVDCFSRIEHEIVIDCRGISPEYLIWGWILLGLGPFPGMEAVVYGGFNYGKLEPILKYNHLNINAIEKTAKGFKFRAIADLVYCSIRRL